MGRLIVPDRAPCATCRLPPRIIAFSAAYARPFYWGMIGSRDAPNRISAKF
jgi:hypothetical protein